MDIMAAQGATCVTGTPQAIHISVRGVVQGVGFRPFVYRIAMEHRLQGWVCNTSGDVRIDVEGAIEELNRFLWDLENQAPPQALIESISTTYHSPTGYQNFEIHHSLAEDGEYQLISPDIATCEACKKELNDSRDRRYRYPFTNCTNCGPRFTIIEDIPYDRPKTTMSCFQMCSECQEEYEGPLDRRFHAQPNACPHCGPSLQLVDREGHQLEVDDPLKSAAELILEGKIVAVKGLGGFLLACDATNAEAVELLRQRKKRPSKPLAVMMTNLEQVHQYCGEVSLEEGALLMSSRAPIVLLQWKHHPAIAKSVAPNLDYLGVMLPYTPMHHVLLEETGIPLVMTSGNLSEEPIAKDNDEAVARLGGIADYLIMHNRGIFSPYDDSVVFFELGKTQLLRRARGYAPYPVHLASAVEQVLACGPHLKNTFCFTKDNYAFVSQHIGDLENLETLVHFEKTIEIYKHLFRLNPRVVACDMHPEYLSTKYAKDVAEKMGMPLIQVQHHHAHIASCMAENQVEGEVIGVSLDGTGYGTDGRIWGGEFLVADYKEFRRVGHLQYLPLPGGAAAIERPYRIALAYLYTLLGEDSLQKELPPMRATSEKEVELIKKQIEKGLNTPLTSSCGRLFDAVSALLGLVNRIGYEGQAAVELEMIAGGIDSAGECYPYDIGEENGTKTVLLRRLFSAILVDVLNGIPAGEISLRFHSTMADMVARMCGLIAEESCLDRVVLSGGVFQNRLLLKKTFDALTSSGLTVITHSQVPCNDGGVSLGQAVIADAVLRIEKGGCEGNVSRCSSAR